MVTSLRSPRRLGIRSGSHASGHGITSTFERRFRQTGRHDVLAAEVDAWKQADIDEADRKMATAQFVEIATAHNELEYYFAERDRLYREMLNKLAEIRNSMSERARTEIYMDWRNDPDYY